VPWPEKQMNHHFILAFFRNFNNGGLLALGCIDIRDVNRDFEVVCECDNLDLRPGVKKRIEERATWSQSFSIGSTSEEQKSSKLAPGSR
jgi:hypothetical protein